MVKKIANILLKKYDVLKMAPMAPAKNTYFEFFEVCKNFKSMILVGAIGANY